MKRFFELDFARGIAVLLMVVFHFAWDLNYFGATNISLYEGFWGILQKMTAGLFLFLVGIGLTVSYNRSQKDYVARFFKKSARVFLYAFLLTGISFLLFPDKPILFGVLHLIGASIVLCIPFVGKKKSSFVAGLALVFLPVFFDLQSVGTQWLFFAGLGTSPPALDFFPLVPWLGAVLVGMSAGNFLHENGKAKIVLEEPKNKAIRLVGFLGRHSLAIYLLHQPFLFALVFLATKVAVA